MSKSLKFLSIVSGLMLLVASGAKADEDNVTILDEESGRRIVLGASYSEKFGRDIFGVHFLEADGTHDMMIDADGGVSSIRLFADNEEVFKLVANPDEPAFELRKNDMILNGGVNENEAVILIGSNNCFEDKQEGFANRCTMIVHSAELGRTGNIIVEDGEVLFGYIIEKDGSISSIPQSSTDGMSDADVISGIGVAIQGYCAVFGCN